MKTPIMRNPLDITETIDWGIIPTMVEGESHVSGVVLHKGGDGQSECGLWICTPGKWDCHVTNDEFCHFLDGAFKNMNDPSGRAVAKVHDDAY